MIAFQPHETESVIVSADGLLIAVYFDPERALCDGEACLKPHRFAALMKGLTILLRAAGRALESRLR